MVAPDAERTSDAGVGARDGGSPKARRAAAALSSPTARNTTSRAAESAGIVMCHPLDPRRELPRVRGRLPARRSLVERRCVREERRGVPVAPEAEQREVERRPGGRPSYPGRCLGGRGEARVWNGCPPGSAVCCFLDNNGLPNQSQVGPLVVGRHAPLVAEPGVRRGSSPRGDPPGARRRGAGSTLRRAPRPRRRARRPR